MHEDHPFTLTHNVAYHGPWTLSESRNIIDRFKKKMKEEVKIKRASCQLTPHAPPLPVLLPPFCAVPLTR